MSSLQKKLFATLFVLLLALAGFWLPHKTINPQPVFNPEVLGESGAPDGLSQLVIEPEAGKQFLLDKINSAQTSLYLSMYLFSDEDFVTALIGAKKRGVEVKVILEKSPFGGGAKYNSDSKEKLLAAGVEVTDPPALIALLHQKSLIIDHKELVILTFNLAKSAFTINREYAISDLSPPDVLEAEQIFDADWKRMPFTPSVPRLVVSPDNSRSKLISLINSAKQTIFLEDEVLEDQEIINLLAQKSDSVETKILLADPKKVAQNLTTAQDLASSKAAVKFLAKPYLHAKLILVDGQFAYLGSVNLTSHSLDQNRELGIIFTNQIFLARLTQQFNLDWENGTLYTKN